jgi:hypothetical protein
MADPSVEKVAGKLVNLMEAKARRAREKPAAAPERPKPREPGVYFGMRLTDYLADPSLSGSGLNLLLRSPSDYWFDSWMNPNHPDDRRTPALLQGKALHALVLEGEEAFARAFAQTPEPAAGDLVTTEDLRARCRSLCLSTSGTKGELARRVKAEEPGARIFDDIMTVFKLRCERAHIEPLKAADMTEVRQAAAAIRLNPHLARAFEGGIAEVSLFWRDENDLPCKCRVDYLKPRTIVDLKKCANARARPFDVAARLAIAEYRYDLHAAHYLDGYRYLHGFAAEGRVFGKCPVKRGWEQRLAPPAEMKFTWVFHQCPGAPVTHGIEVPPGANVLNRAVREIAKAKRTYRDCRERFGTNQWIADGPIVELGERDLPAWLREDVEVL